METLNVAIIAPTYLPVPAKMYGGIEPVIFDLANAVGKRGHQVTLIAAKGSEKPINGELYEVSGGRESFEDESRAFAEYADILGAFDLISDHTHTHAVFLQKMLCPDLVIQVTRHSQWNPQTPPPKSANPNVPLPEPRPYNFCGISNHHARECSGLSGMVFRTLYNGIDLERYPFQEKKGNRLLFVGRMEPFKLPQWALSAAIALRMPIDFIGKDHDTNQEFVKSLKIQIVEAKSKGYDVEYLGEVDHETKLRYMQNAKALLFPAGWSEPFGLVPVEAMACGTPVICTVAGALPEIVKHGETGWLASGLDDFISYVPKSEQIDPLVCRKHVEEKFSAEIMSDNYIKIWREILSGKGW